MGNSFENYSKFLLYPCILYFQSFGPLLPLDTGLPLPIRLQNSHTQGRQTELKGSLVARSKCNSALLDHIVLQEWIIVAVWILWSRLDGQLRRGTLRKALELERDRDVAVELYTAALKMPWPSALFPAT